MPLELIHAECVAEMSRLADRGVAFDAIVTDPPYHLTSIVKRFSGGSPEHTQTAKDIVTRRTPMARLAKGFLNKTWDGGDVAFRVETWRAAYRVLKPGGWLLSFGSTRGHHRMACAIEDAGFEIRDTILDLISSDTRVKNFVETLSPEQVGAFAEILQQAGLQGMIAWCFGSGMPKSLNVERSVAEKLCTLPGRHFWTEETRLREKESKPGDHVCPSCKESLEWEGYQTGLKPSFEPIVVARKPIERSVADNVLKYRTGALNIDACRVGPSTLNQKNGKPGYDHGGWGGLIGSATVGSELGRHPANLIHDGSDEVLESFAKYGERTTPSSRSGSGWRSAYVGGHKTSEVQTTIYHDTGTAARFFYSSKASDNDKVEDNSHPTVKPVSLIYYLLKLVVPKGGSVLDPFAGTGPIATAAHYLNVNCTMIEADATYAKDIEKRIKSLHAESLFSLAEEK